jgi:hypothetical protein
MLDFLARAGIYCNQLVLDCGAGVRYLINDVDPEQPTVNKAVAVNITRNSGLNGIKLE